MRWPDVSAKSCPVARSLAILGDRWTMLVIREAFLGTRRFEEFEAYLEISPHILSSRIARLVKAGVLRKVPYQERPPRFEYRLTDRGRDLYPVLAGLVRWGNAWTTDRPLTRLRHRSCGHETSPRTVCVACGEDLNPREMEAMLSDDMRAERAAQKESYLARKRR